jgi:hypothetical protein
VPHWRPTPITRRPIPQVSFGLHSRGGSFGPTLTEDLDPFKGARSLRTTVMVMAIV